MTDGDAFGFTQPVQLNPVAGIHEYVLPRGGPETFNCAESFGQMETSGPALTTGNGLAVTVTLEVLVQPLTSVPITEYVLEEEGLAVTVVPVEDDNPVEGDHK